MSRLQVKAARVPTGEEGARVWRGMATAYCCDEMEEAWEDRVIGFGAHDEETVEAAVNLYDCKIWPEGPIWTEYAIRFCPFCGQEVLLEIVGE